MKGSDSNMKCKKCGSENVTVQMISENASTRTNHTSILRVFGRMILIVCTCGLWIFVPKRKENGKTKFKNKKQAICQDCGHSWNI